MDQFPKKLGAFAFLFTVFFIAGLGFQTWNSRNYIVQVNNLYFPILERNSINVRLADKLKNILELAAYKKDKSLIDGFFLYRDALTSNLEDHRILLTKISYPEDEIQRLRRDDIEVFENQIAKAIKREEWEKATTIVKSDEFLEASQNLDSLLTQVTENLSTRRDEELKRQETILAYGAIFFSVCLTVVVLFWGMVLSAYRHNVRRRQAMEKELETQRSKSVHAAQLASLGEMAGGIAHEINNPLAIIGAVIQRMNSQLKKGTLTSESGLELMKKASKTVNRIAKIIKSLRTFSRDASKDPMQDVFLPELISDTLELGTERMKNNQIQFHVQDIPEVTISGRPIQISQILVNLLNNAFDAVNQRAEKSISLSFSTLSEMIQIQITDSGAGIPDSVRQKIMQPFFTTKEVGKGTGLGLSLSLEIAKNHGGNLYLDTSNPQTTFVLELPLRKADAIKSAA